MKLVFGAVVTDGAGKTGGQVASHNKGGAYLRTKVSPINKNSAAQSRSRSVLGNLSKGWASLTPAQQQQWAAFALNYSGKKSRLNSGGSTGKAMYIGCNARLSVGSLSLITTPVVPTSANRIKSVTWTNTAHNLLRLTVTLFTFTAGIRFLTYSTGSLSAGVSFTKFKWKFLTAITPGSVTSNFNINVPFTNVYGNLPAGTRLRAKVIMLDSASGIVLQEELSPFVVTT